MSTTATTTTDPEIAAQQKKSLMADSEAQIKVSSKDFETEITHIKSLLDLGVDRLGPGPSGASPSTF